MAVETRNQLKQWFQTGDYPTEAQFAAWIDSFFHLGDTIGMVNVTGLLTALQLKADQSTISVLFPVVLAPGVSQWLVPAGTVIEFFWIIEPSSIAFGVGTTNGGNEWLEPNQLAAGGDIVESKKGFVNATTIYFSGIQPTTIIKIFKR